MSTFMTGNNIVDDLGRFELKGITIPQSWYKAIRTNGGRPHYLAILILGDIVSAYWPKLIEEEITGKVLGYYKQFSGELLQRSYDIYAEMFGVDKETVKRAIVTLEQLGIVRRIFRTVKEQNGIVRNNVLFLELNVQNLYVMTYRKTMKEKSEYLHKKADTRVSAAEEGHTEVNTPMVMYDWMEEEVEGVNDSTSVQNGQTMKTEGMVKNEQREECDYSDEEIQHIINEFFDWYEEIFKTNIVSEKEEEKHIDSKSKSNSEWKQGQENSQMVVSVGIVSTEKGKQECRKIEMDVALKMG